MTKNELKYYSSLLKKKTRNEENKFLVEGRKIVEEGLKSNFGCEIIFAQNSNVLEQEIISSIQQEKGIRVEILKKAEFEKLTDTVTPQGIAAVFLKPGHVKNPINELTSDLIIALENISDPGNLGTIIRSCDWFGVNEIILSGDCADVYNSKTIRASMGSMFHVKMFEDVNLPDCLLKLKSKKYKILCADLNGTSIFSIGKPGKSAIIFANESNGPSGKLLSLADEIVTIPKSGKAESLNVASASAIILANLSR